MFGVVWDCYSSKLKGKRYKQNTPPKTYKTKIKILTNPGLAYSTAQKNNARARSSARSSCAARTRKQQKGVKLRFFRKKFQTQEVQNPICKKPQEVTSPTANRK